MKYLLDTNVLSEPVKPAADDSVLKRLALFEREIATAAPVFHELQYGVRRLAESAKRRLLTFLGIFGAHRFYLEKWISGIIYLLTGGLLGVGYLYDLWTLNDQVTLVNQRQR